MSGASLQAALNEAVEENRRAIESMRSAGVRKAQTEAAYRSALATCMLRLRAERCPAAILKDAARGDASVNRALLESELAAGEYDACKEDVMLCKRNVDVIREQIAREYTQAGWR